MFWRHVCVSGLIPTFSSCMLLGLFWCTCSLRKPYQKAKKWWIQGPGFSIWALTEKNLNLMCVKDFLSTTRSHFCLNSYHIQESWLKYNGEYACLFIIFTYELLI
jgi:hypothetical protein